jgi:GNAT superfamily N-acetyltransferase
MIRIAKFADIPRLVEIRAAVRENQLSDPKLVTFADYEWHVANAPIFVWDVGVVVGMSAGDPRDGSIWALFVEPLFEGRGFGRALIEAACRSLAAAGHKTARLTTSPKTRAERFYLRNGWHPVGFTESGEIQFEKAL